MKRIMPVTILLILFSAAAAHAGQVILTTFYPAPFGAYDRMKLRPRARLADTHCSNIDHNRSLYYSNSSAFGSKIWCNSSAFGSRIEEEGLSEQINRSVPILTRMESS